MENNIAYPKVAIIILNWNGWEDTIECLESLYQITYPNYEVIVVDNGSEDESVEKIKEYCEGKIEVESKFFEYNPSNKPIYVVEYEKEQAEKGGDLREEKYMSKLESDRKIRLVKNEKNYGFAEGNNIGMRYALITLNSEEYILLLNNDTVVDKRFLDELVRTAERDERIGAISPKTYYYHEPNKLQTTYRECTRYLPRGPLPGQGYIDEGQFDEETETGVVYGMAFFIKKDVIYDVGLFNSAYFCYSEEIELCQRIKKASYRMVYCPKAKVWHKVSSSVKKISGFKEYYHLRNLIWLVKEHGVIWEKILIVPYSMFRLIFKIILKDPKVIFDKSIIIMLFKGLKDGHLDSPKSNAKKSKSKRRP